MPNIKQLAFQQGNKCFLCNKPVRKERQSVEHLVPRSQGGTSDDSNTAMICKRVNQMLGDKTIKEKIIIIMRHGNDFRCPETEQ